jgi:hypothetical protein
VPSLVLLFYCSCWQDFSLGWTVSFAKWKRVLWCGDGSQEN